MHRHRSHLPFFALGLVVTPVAAVARAVPEPPCVFQIASGTLTPPFPGEVRAIAWHDDGLDPQSPGGHFYAGGSVFASRGTSVQRLSAKGWQNMGDKSMGPITGLTSIPDGLGINGGPSLYAATISTSRFPSSVGRWDVDTSAWRPVLPSPGDSPGTLVWFDDQTGGGPTLHAVYEHAIKKLEVSGWRTLVTFTSASIFVRDRVFVHDDDGAGPNPAAIYFCGGIRSAINPDGIRVDIPSGIARWNGRTLAELPNPLEYGLKTATLHDDGVRGATLYISGHTPYGPNALALSAINRWNTSIQNWEPVGQPGEMYIPAQALAGIPARAGQHEAILFAAGRYTLDGANTGAYGNVAVWNNVAWRGNGTTYPFASGGSDYFHLPAAAGRFGAGHDRPHAALVVTRAQSTETTFLGLLPCQPCRADINLDGAVDPSDIFSFLDDYFAQHISANVITRGRAGVNQHDLIGYLNLYFAGCD